MALIQAMKVSKTLLPECLSAVSIAVCDPVMGDHGKLYVKPEVVPCYQEIVPLATIMTPNQFEAEKLVGERIVTEEDAFAACTKLHERGVATVVSALYTKKSMSRKVSR